MKECTSPAAFHARTLYLPLKESGGCSVKPWSYYTWWLSGHQWVLNVIASQTISVCKCFWVCRVCVVGMSFDAKSAKLEEIKTGVLLEMPDMFWLQSRPFDVSRRSLDGVGTSQTIKPRLTTTSLQGWKSRWARFIITRELLNARSEKHFYCLCLFWGLTVITSYRLWDSQQLCISTKTWAARWKWKLQSPWVKNELHFLFPHRAEPWNTSLRTGGAQNNHCTDWICTMINI